MNRNRIRWMGAAVVAVLVAGCGGGERGREAPPPFLAFGCAEDERFLAAFSGPDTAQLVAPDGIHTLVRVPTASGSRYAGGADTLWIHGQEALLIRGPRTLRGCLPTGRQRVLADLWRSGAVFTAAGNEPFWTLTAWPDSLVLVQDMGALVRKHPLRTPVDWGVAGGYADAAAGIVVELEAGPCLDTMSGAPFPCGVAIRWAGREFTGCGMTLGPRF